MSHFFRFSKFIKSLKFKGRLCCLLAAALLSTITKPVLAEPSKTPEPPPLLYAPALTGAAFYSLPLAPSLIPSPLLPSRIPWLSRLRFSKALLPTAILVTSGVFLTTQLQQDEAYGLSISPTQATPSDLDKEPDPDPPLVPAIFPEKGAEEAEPGKWKAVDSIIATTVRRHGDADVFFASPDAEVLLSTVSGMSSVHLRKRMAQITLYGKRVFTGPSLRFWNRRHLFNFMATGLSSALETHIFISDILGGKSTNFAQLYGKDPLVVEKMHRMIIQNLEDYQITFDHPDHKNNKLVDSEPGKQQETLDQYMQGFQPYMDEHSEATLDKVLARLHPDNIPSWKLFQELIASQRWFQKELPSSSQITADQYQLFASEVLTSPFLKHLFCSRIIGATTRLRHWQFAEIYHVPETAVVLASLYLKLQLLHVMAGFEGSQLSQLKATSHYQLVHKEHTLYKDLLAWKALSPSAWVSQMENKLGMSFGLSPAETDFFSDFVRQIEFKELDSDISRANYLYYGDKQAAKKAAKWGLRVSSSSDIHPHEMHSYVVTLASMGFEMMDMPELAEKVHNAHHQKKLKRLEKLRKAQANRPQWLAELKGLFAGLQVNDSDSVLKEESAEHSVYRIFDSNGNKWLTAEIALNTPEDAANEVVVYVNTSTENPGSRVGGWAAHIFFDGLSLHVRGSTASTDSERMEIIAVKEALRYTHRDDVVEIHTRSANLYNIFDGERWLDKWDSGGWIAADDKAVANQDLLVPFVNMVQSRPIHFLFVEDDSVHLGNQRDAREAREHRIHFAGDL